MLAELDHTGESQISLTHPDSRAMTANTHVAVGHNVQIAVDAKHKLSSRSQTKLWIWVCWHRPPNRQKKISEWSGSRSWPIEATSRSRTSRPARKPGSTLTCRAPSVALRSEQACSEKPSSATTQPATASCAQQVSIFIPIHHR